MYVFTDVYVYVPVFIYIYMHVCTHMYVLHVCIYIYAHTCKYVFKYMDEIPSPPVANIRITTFSLISCAI